ncbi:MAG TPA: hypothetical protein VEM41_03225 [Actinomycetota bacterium]|nr:hypothetical protein [Actinomycetota bacterium]
MKIKLVHTECGREVLVHQLLESQGHCPWDGKPISRDYTAVLASSLEAAEAAGSALELALDRIAGLGGEMRLDEDSVLGALRERVDRVNHAGEEVPA